MFSVSVCFIHEERIRELERKLQNAEGRVRKLEKEKEILLNELRMLLAAGQVNARESILILVHGVEKKKHTFGRVFRFRCPLGVHLCTDGPAPPPMAEVRSRRFASLVGWKEGSHTSMAPIAYPGGHAISLWTEANPELREK